MNEESLVQYGTPLQCLDEDTIHKSKAQRISDQVVTDKQGRRRFHGAFTGGFSAGYFNSVGSKEGWTPSSFVSSRSKRVEKLCRNDPTAFMDEEDLDSFGIAVERIQATSDYEDTRAQNKRKTMDDWRGPIPGKPVLQELLKPVNLTVGMKLLMKLGWRPGQGIGPRVSKQEKKRTRKERGRLQPGKTTSEKHTATSSSESEEEEEGAEPNVSAGLGFAPDDVEGDLWKNSKPDFFGLGYKPLEKGNVLGGKSQPQSLNIMEKQKRIAIKGQAFGVGAFEEDDEDIYSKEDMSEYDFELGPSSGETMRQRGPSRWDANMCVLEEHLEGFHLSRAPLPKPKSIPLPSLLPGFSPWHESYRRRFGPKGDECPKRLSYEERKRIVSHPPSVEIRSGVKKTEATTRAHDEPSSQGSSSFLSTFVEAPRDGEEFPPSASSVDLGRKPFAANPEKQSRYEAYLTVKGKDLTGVFPPFMTEWEREREKEEFARAAGFRKPFSLAISSRFTPASFDEGVMKGFSEGLNSMKSVGTAEGSTSGTSVLQEETREDVKAAKAKMFGRLTQTRCQWHPDKILCKRFNVPHPFPHSTSVGVPLQPKERLNIFNFLSDTSSPSNNPALESSAADSLSTETTQTPLQETKESEEHYGLKVPVSDPPTLDLFKAIFEDSSDSETEEEDAGQKSELFQKKEVKETEKQLTESLGGARMSGNNQKQTFEKESGSLSDSAPKEQEVKKRELTTTLTIPQEKLDPDYIASRAKGVFKGIDFAALNEYRSVNTAKRSENDPTDSSCGSQNRFQFDTQKEDERGRRRSSSTSPVGKAALSLPTLLDEEYGPEPPAHMLQGGNTLGGHPKSFAPLSSIPMSKSLIEIEERKKKKRKKHKHRKQKKKESKRRK